MILRPSQPAAADLQRFVAQLTAEEKKAIEWWLNVGAAVLRPYQLDGLIPANSSAAEMSALEDRLNRALAKAVVCRGIVFRGLSASVWRPEAMDYLGELVTGRGEIVLRSHDSATYSEQMGREWCRTEVDDDPRDLAVLLRIESLTSRHLAPFVHRHKDEQEVVLLKGSRYQRVATRRLPDPKINLTYWEVDLTEQ
jgi:hypothetical protein